jgi:hypothetical protein
MRRLILAAASMLVLGLASGAGHAGQPTGSAGPFRTHRAAAATTLPQGTQANDVGRSSYMASAKPPPNAGNSGNPYLNHPVINGPTNPYLNEPGAHVDNR